MKRIAKVVILGGLALTLTACIAGTTDSAQAATGPAMAQMVLGFWHGLLAPFLILAELARRFFPASIHFSWTAYQAGVVGFPYNIGYCFGLVSWPFMIWARLRRP